jgi:SAM-dependent methyltransferase
MMDGLTPRSGTLVDVGSGIGVGTEEAVRVAPAGTYAVTVLLEPQRGMLLHTRRGRAPSPGAERILAAGDRLPFADASVDVLLSLGVLCCMRATDVPRAVSELSRVARPGGYCVLGVPPGWAPTTDPLFAAAGFTAVRSLRPGRVLYRRFARPDSAAGPVTPPV